MDSITGTRVLRLGTRGSKLAMAQATTMRGLLLETHPGIEVEIVPIRTSGDRGEREQLGAFVREIQQSLLNNEVDVALHCLKDLPTQSVDGLCLAAHLEREDASDTIITRGPAWTDLPEGATVGTGSVRRTGQLRAIRQDFNFKPLVGNVDTRMRKLQEGEYDGIVLAIAGLKRLGVLDAWQDSPYANLKVDILDPEVMLPAPGQAILVLETRENDPAMELVSGFNHPATEASARAERAFLASFGGGCSVPVAALATCVGWDMTLTGRVTSPSGDNVVEGRHKGRIEDPERVGRELAQLLGRQGAFELFDTAGAGGRA